MARDFTYSTTRNTFFYNFFPPKDAEEDISGVGRAMVEIRDIFPPPAVSPWRINKTLSQHEIDSGKIVISRNDMFEHVLRYWSVDSARYAANEGQRVHVAVHDCTQDPKYPRKYNVDEAYLVMAKTEDFVLSCMPLIKDRNLKVYDDISLYWDIDKSCFMFKLLL